MDERTVQVPTTRDIQVILFGNVENYFMYSGFECINPILTVFNVSILKEIESFGGNPLTHNVLLLCIEDRHEIYLKLRGVFKNFYVF